MKLIQRWSGVCRSAEWLGLGRRFSRWCFCVLRVLSRPFQLPFPGSTSIRKSRLGESSGRVSRAAVGFSPTAPRQTTAARFCFYGTAFRIVAACPFTARVLKLGGPFQPVGTYLWLLRRGIEAIFLRGAGAVMLERAAIPHTQQRGHFEEASATLRSNKRALAHTRIFAKARGLPIRERRFRCG